MTAREVLMRRYRWDRIAAPFYLVLSSVLTIVPLLAALVWGDGRPIRAPWFWVCWLAFMLVGGDTLSASAWHLWRRSQCPWCLKSLMLLLPGVLDGRVRYCPSCGKSLDEKLPPQVKTRKARWEDDLA